ncbi:AAA-domain-containing protein [Eremomyces bilateralis CBS 781.70]|uniref:AAA-domain-containing protein n=1 Tax=Eremomyces bilateralis CBS 781.70 TaxID=1392243 RepID=A0A6G1G1Q0_9PEZI|nr:AAA-domain-containing protein [Eremomyces bilateralis CBS 781.70]KAF1811973.1 AAA-domain-containing protein [Eremomyces bilateralis CBS 781.70]
MSSGSTRRWQYVADLLMAAALPVMTYLAMKTLLSHLDFGTGDREKDKKDAAAAARKLDRLLAARDNTYEDDVDKRKNLELTQYERQIALEVVMPSDIPVSFKDIGGLDDIIEELRESVIYPLTLPHLYSRSSSLLSAPSGVLLYGPPGCGKTMLAKALAHESGATFINLHISTLTEKWYGDSNKLVNAVFSLARKLQPSIVFIDEIDALLGTRRSGEHEANGMVKAEFMTHWDGLTSVDAAGSAQRICILGATNRIQDIDEAILRRMPKKFPVALPSAHQRRNIFKLILSDTTMDPDFDLDYLVKLSAGMSGSDIKEACRDAAMVPVRESIRALQKKNVGRDLRAADIKEIRGVRTADFFGKGAGMGYAVTNQTQTTDDIDASPAGSKRGVDSDAEGDSSYTDTEEEVEEVEAAART